MLLQRKAPPEKQTVLTEAEKLDLSRHDLTPEDLLRLSQAGEVSQQESALRENAHGVVGVARKLNMAALCGALAVTFGVSGLSAWNLARRGQEARAITEAFRASVRGDGLELPSPNAFDRGAVRAWMEQQMPALKEFYTGFREVDRGMLTPEEVRMYNLALQSPGPSLLTTVDLSQPLYADQFCLTDAALKQAGGDYGRRGDLMLQRNLFAPEWFDERISALSPAQQVAYFAIGREILSPSSLTLFARDAIEPGMRHRIFQVVGEDFEKVSDRLAAAYPAPGEYIAWNAEAKRNGTLLAAFFLLSYAGMLGLRRHHRKNMGLQGVDLQTLNEEGYEGSNTQVKLRRELGLVVTALLENFRDVKFFGATGEERDKKLRECLASGFDQLQRESARSNGLKTVMMTAEERDMGILALGKAILATVEQQPISPSVLARLRAEKRYLPEDEELERLTAERSPADITGYRHALARVYRAELDKLKYHAWLEKITRPLIAELLEGDSTLRAGQAEIGDVDYYDVSSRYAHGRQRFEGWWVQIQSAVENGDLEAVYQVVQQLRKVEAFKELCSEFCAHVEDRADSSTSRPEDYSFMERYKTEEVATDQQKVGTAA